MLINRRTLVTGLGVALVMPRPSAWAEASAASHALSLYGDVKYPPGFTHVDYVNPDAPRGGSVRFGDLGTFDNVNPYILKGVSFVRFSNSFMSSGSMFDSLMAGSADEPSTAYGLIAESVEFPDDRMSITFNLREQARFHDGSPITAQDVVWSHQILTTKGHPAYRVMLADVDTVQAEGERRVTFRFKNNTDRTLPLTVSGLPVLPSKWWEGKEFDRPSLDPLLGNGPYRMAEIQPGRAIIWERVKDYWAQDLPIVRGTSNFDRIQVDYYRDHTVMREAFKAGLIDVFEENTAAEWQNSYDFPAVKQGLVIKREVKHDVPQGMQRFVFNTRRPLFQDIRVRQALVYALDFQWYNKTYFYDSYKRCKSYWNNCDLGSSGLPEGDELALLERYRDRVPETVFTQVFDPPDYPDPTAFREGLRTAFGLLKAAGWSYQDNRLVNDATGQPFEFEFMNDEPRLERVILPFLQNLQRLGIKGTIRSVDAAQADIRTREYDYDMLSVNYGASLNPGAELRQMYSSVAADTPGSSNLSGIKDPVVDELIELVVNADTRPELVTRVRALDRVLLHGNYGVPNWYQDKYRVAYWDEFGIPEVQPKYVSMPAGSVPMWWIDSSKAANMAKARERIGQP